jgi:hypothetical protein
MAAGRDSLFIVDFLLKNGADIHAKAEVNVLCMRKTVAWHAVLYYFFSKFELC